jgi:hypothetical protein
MNGPRNGNTNNPKEGARSMNEDAGQNNPCIVDRHKRRKNQENYSTGPRRGKHSHKK